MEGMRTDRAATAGYQGAGARSHSQLPRTARLEEVRPGCPPGALRSTFPKDPGHLFEHRVDATLRAEPGEVGLRLLSPFEEPPCAMGLILPPVREVFLRLDGVRHYVGPVLLLDKGRHGGRHVEQYFVQRPTAAIGPGS